MVVTFKLGDVVELTKDPFGWHREGSTGVVVPKCKGTPKDHIAVRLHDFKDYSAPDQYHGFPEKNLKLASKLVRVLL